MARYKAPTDPAILLNDPSLKWNPYRKGEAIYSDDLGKTVRFSHFDSEGQVCLLDLVLRELPGTYSPLKVRRP